MTRAQLVIMKYIRLNFVNGSVRIEMIGLDKVRITDHKGDCLTFTVNLYCDILDADTGQLYAKSGLPHDISTISMEMLTTWKEMPRL